MHVRPNEPGETAAAMVAHVARLTSRTHRDVLDGLRLAVSSVFQPVYPFAVGLPTVLNWGGAVYDPWSPW
jgi:hypothetical protein